MSLNIGQLYASLTLNSGQFNASLQAAQNAMRNFGSSSSSTFGGVTQQAGVATTAIQNLGLAVTGLTSALGYLTMEGLKQNSTLEQQTIAFKFLTGSVKEAKQVIKDLRVFVRESPFESREVFQVGQLFMNAGVKGKDLIEIVKAVGDASAVTGENMVENFKGASLAISQMMLKGKISSEEMTKQLSNRGIPAWTALSLATGKSVQELKKLAEEGKLGREYIDDLVQGLKMMRDGASAAQATTFGGLISQLKDLSKIFLQEITADTFLNLKDSILGIVRPLEKLVANEKKLQELRNQVDRVTTAFLSLGGAIFNAFAGLEGTIVDQFLTSFENINTTVAELGSNGAIQEFTDLSVLGFSQLIETINSLVQSFTTATQPIVSLLNVFLGFESIGAIIGTILGLVLAFNLVTAGIKAVTTVSMIVLKAFSAGAVANAYYTSTLGAQNIALLQNAAIQETQLGLVTQMAIAENTAAGRYALLTSTIIQSNVVELSNIKIKIARAQAELAAAMATTTATAAEIDALKTNLATLAVEEKQINNLFEETYARQVATGAITAETKALIQNTVAQVANNEAQLDNVNNTKDQIAENGKFAATMTKVGVIAGILAALFGIFERAITGTNDKTLAIIKSFGDLAAVMAGIVVIIAQGVVVAVGFLGYVLARVANSIAHIIKVMTLGIIDLTGATESLVESSFNSMKYMVGQMGNVADQMDRNAQSIADRIAGREKKTTEQLKQEEIDRKRVIINMAKTTVTEKKYWENKYWSEMIKQAKAGSRMYLEALAELDNSIIKRMIDTEKKKLQIEKTQLDNTKKAMKEMKSATKTERLSDQVKGADGKMITVFRRESETHRQKNQQAAQLMEQAFVAERKGNKKLAQSLRAQAKKIEIPLEKLLTSTGQPVYKVTKMTQQEIEENFGKTEKQIEITISSIQDRIAELNALVNTPVDEPTTDEDGLTDTQRKTIQGARTALKDELDQMTDEINKRNDIEVKAIEDFYDKQVKAIEDGIEQKRRAYETEENTITKAELEEEKAFLIRSIDKEAIERVKEIDKELRKMQAEAEIQVLEDNAVAKKELLDKQKDDALQAQELLVRQRINNARIELNEVFKMNEEKLKEGKMSIFGFTKEISDASTKLAENLLNTGSNWTTQLIKNIEDAKPLLSKAVDDLVSLLDINTKLGEFKITGVNQFDLLDKLMSATSKMQNPMEAGRLASTTNNFNSPFIQINGVAVGDKLDAQTFGQNIFDGMNNAARAKGINIFA